MSRNDLNLDAAAKHEIAENLLNTLDGAKLDGGRKNILISECPFCGHKGFKYGIYIGREVGSKQFGSSNCFHCGRSFRTLDRTLEALGRMDLMPTRSADLDSELGDELHLFEDELDDSLVEIKMPRGYKRTHRNKYLKGRGFNPDDFDYFPCGTNRGIERDLSDYVILEIIDNGKTVGYCARNTMDKDEIDEYNERHRYQIRRYLNSTENDFSKLLYNYDAVIQYETNTVILTEGCFDCIALNRKMELYDNPRAVPVATFGKKISDVQIYKLQQKGVEQVIIGYDNDHPETISSVAERLDKYFDVLIACLPEDCGAKDWDEADDDVVYDVFANGLLTVREFNLTGEV